MKPAIRLVTSICLLTLIGCLSGCVQHYKVDPDPAKRLQIAKSRETQAPVEALDEYTRISNEYANAEASNAEDTLKYRNIAGDVLLTAVEFGYKALDPAKLNEATTPIARAELEGMQSNVGDKAHQAAKQLFDSFGDTNAAKKALEPKYGEKGDQNLRQALETRMDHHNAVQPSYKLVNFLVHITGAIPHFSYWFALLFIALFVKLVTLPLMLKTYKSQREMAKVQPILKDIQERYKDDRKLMNEKVLEAYKEHKINPMASCFPMLIQLPFLWWVYNAVRLYEFHFSNGYFLWVSPLSAGTPPGFLGRNLGQFDIILTLLYAASNYVTMRLTPPSDPQQAQTQKQMSIMMTFMMLYFFLTFKWSSAFTFYWLIMNIIGAWQSYHYIYKPKRDEVASGGVVVLPSNTPKNSANKTPTNGARPKMKSNKRR